MSWSAHLESTVIEGQGPTPAVIEGIAAAEGVLLGRDGARHRSRQLVADHLGLGPLEALVDDVSITDVLVNGDGSVWVDRGAGVTREPGAQLGDASSVRRLAVRLAGLAGRRLDDAQPWVDGLLPGGVRLHAVVPPLVEGAHISLRLARQRSGGLDRLSEIGMLTDGQADLLRELVARRAAYVVTGGTGTGKTTLLAALLAEVPTDERLVVVEDVGEIRVEHPHVVRLQARAANTEGVGEVGMVTLVRQALRMRPDRLVVGEVRGAEVREMLLALNTGHEGGCGTLHANRAEDVPARFEALGALAGMSREAVQSQLRTALDVVVHLRRDDGRRQVSSITDLAGRELGSTG